ncbi:MAG: putative phosphodiesterase, partial [Acidimicrobiia bacterium]|nr:putative phosphodiesterase [Acidimicrobiia bacterium]
MPLPSLEVPPVGFAHRGARAHAPENTLPAFELALRLGATGLESDVWRTADGEVVLDHDGFVRQGVRRRPIGQMRRDQLPPHIPTLRDLLERCGTDFHLSLDLKDVDSGPAVIEVVRAQAPELLPRLWLCERNFDHLRAIRSLDDQVRLVNSTRLRRIKEGPERRAADLAEAGIDAINLHQSDWTGGLTTMYHRFGVRCLAWDL